MELSGEQAQAKDRIERWIGNPDAPRTLYVAGPAGCGKTVLMNALEGVDFICAPTGKAAHVLRRKGVTQAQTLHKLLYTPAEGRTEELQNLLLAYADEKDDEVKAKMLVDIKRERAKARPSFSLRDDCAAIGKVVGVDEASMVGGRVYDDLLSVAKKVLLIGDPFQLQPVKDFSVVTNRTPDVELRHIHRQAMDSPVLALATAIRVHGTEALTQLENNGTAYRSTIGPAGRVRVYTHPSEAPREIYTGNDALLVSRNATRTAFNARFRELLGHEGRYPNVGEKVVVLRNDYEFNVWNGGVYKVRDNKPGSIELEDEAGVYPDIPYDLGTPAEVDRGIVPIDYGYALTCHKAQGSEWDSVTVYAQDRSPQWLYTALTRARTNCDVILA